VNKRIVFLGISTLVAAFVISHSSSILADTLWAGDQNGNLISVDTNTGAGIPVGQETEFPLSTEIEFDPITQTLYSDEFNGFTNLHTIDPATGQSTGFVSHGCCAYTGMEFVGTTLYVTNIDPGMGKGPEFDPSDFDGGPTAIFLDVVDPSTGMSVRIGPTNTPPISGLAYDADAGIMYGVTAGGAPADLVSVNLDTGNATTLVPLTDVTGAQLGAVGSIEFAQNGVLYGAVAMAGNINPGWLFSIDIGTGVVTFIGDTGLPSITGLTNPDGDGVISEFARFLVSKDFSDDNPAEVEVTLTCNTGLPLQQTTTIAEGDPVNFVVGDFEQGELNCEVTENVPLGYTASYLGGNDDNDTTCAWENLLGGQYGCVINNDLDEVEIEVTKVWIDENPQFSPSNVAEAEWFCQNVANDCDGLGCNNSGELGFYGNPDTDSFFVRPDWEDGTTCSVVEVNIADGGVEVDDSDCQQILVFPGDSAACTIFNTRLFEGIPTLSHYGLGILALLMLGVALVASRRFV